jgi:two-component SAPR family response regulator
MKLNWSHENVKVLGIYFSLDLNCITDINFTKKIKEVKNKKGIISIQTYERFNFIDNNTMNVLVGLQF